LFVCGQLFYSPMAAVPKTRRTQRERTGETRERLLAATIDCVYQLGYSRTTTTEIAAHAGVSRGAQLHHFPRKEDLVVAAVEHLFTTRITEFRKVFKALPHGSDSGREAIALLWSMFKGPTFYAWLELVVASRTDRELREKVQSLTDRFAQDVDQTFREFFAPSAEVGAEFDAVPGFVFAVLEGLALERIAGLEDAGLKVLALLEKMSALFPLGTQTRR
jgi:AcrR family transcriptional regulator